jgi:hypothetical protein
MIIVSVLDPSRPGGDGRSSKRRAAAARPGAREAGVAGASRSLRRAVVYNGRADGSPAQRFAGAIARDESPESRSREALRVSGRRRQNRRPRRAATAIASAGV